MDTLTLNPGTKKIVFASDFHLGAPDFNASLKREKKLVRWLDSVKEETSHIFFMGDVFDFWFEYKKVVPKGYIRFLGKVAELSDSGIKIYLFRGNHDMWMFDYFRRELNAEIISDNLVLKIGDKKIFVGHGDGLGPGDHVYKLLRKVFRNRICQTVFGLLPPRVGMGIAQSWSKKSRLSNGEEEGFNEEKEYLIKYIQEVEKKRHHDYYIFGHRHLVIDFPVNDEVRYINTGQWVSDSHYAVFHNTQLELKKFEKGPVNS